MKTVLVTGATGGLGRNAVDYLLSRGVSVRATGRNREIGVELLKQGVEFFPVDLVEAGAARLTDLVRGVDSVWHCAALSSPWGQLQDFMRANVYATNNMLNSAGRNGVKSFVHISTPALYFDFKHQLLIPETYRPSKFVNAYAQTKALAEECVLKSTREYPSMHHTILRPRAIFGRHDQVLFPRLEALLTQYSGRLPLPRAGKTILDMTYAENVVYAMWLASTVKGSTSGSAYNVTNEDPQEVGQTLRYLFERELQRPFAIKHVPYGILSSLARGMEAVASWTNKEPKMTAYSIGALAFNMTLDLTKIKRELGYVPPISMATGLKLTADWIRKQHG